MTIKELLFKDFDVDLPIKGGNGNSIDQPVIIERIELISNYVGIEYDYLTYLGYGRQIEWKLISQQLLSHNERIIDKIKIETVQKTELEEITQIENYYFDITECYYRFR